MHTNKKYKEVQLHLFVLYENSLPEHEGAVSSRSNKLTQTRGTTDSRPRQNKKCKYIRITLCEAIR